MDGQISVEAEIDSVIQDVLLGHSGGGEGKNYGSALYPLRPLVGAVARVNYPGATFIAR